MKKLWLVLFLSALLFHILIQASSHHQSNALLLLSTSSDIRIINTTKINNKAQKPIILIPKVGEGVAIDYQYAGKKLCWTDHVRESIQCIAFDGVEVKNSTETVISGITAPDGLACDWITNKLYWTDSEINRIEVATMTGEYRKVLYWVDIDQPRAIALVPAKGFLFWTDWGEFPKIERAGMNGDHKTRSAIVSEDIFWPNGLAIDYDAERVYWIDGKLLYLSAVDYDGGNRKKIVDKGLVYPYALDYHQNRLYWTDWTKWYVYMFDQTSSTKPEQEVHLNEIPMHIHVYDPSRQPITPNPCSTNNGGCSHLCLLAPYPPGYSCACPIGVKLLNNYTCANGPDELLILARRTDICVIYLDSPDYTYKVLPLNNVMYTIAIDYDPVTEFMYWSDDSVKKIQRAKLDGSQQGDVVVDEIQHPDGVAIDWVARNLYWTDTGTDRIEVAHLENNYRTVIISDGLYQPRAIAVAPELGWMFWSDWYQKAPKIERSNLDGTERTLIVSTKLAWPNGVALDIENRKVYWCDAKTDKIEYANMDGSDRIELIDDNLPHPFGFSLMGDYLFWTDWQRRAIDRAHKENGSNREVIVDQIPNVMGIKAVRLRKTTDWNICSDNNGNCSHICLFRNDKTRVCACQWGYELTADGLNCVLPKAYLLYAKNAGIGRMSIENVNTQNELMVPVIGLKYASKIDVDVNNDRIYWSDSQTKTIMRAFTNGSDPQRVIDMGLASPEGIAVDWLAFNIYWADPAAHRIEVSRLTGSSRKVLIWKNVDEPHSIALDPPAGYMYWSEWGKSHTIKKAAMDGSKQIHLTSTKGYATSLTLDYEDKRLYWVEINAGCVMSSDFNGNAKKTIIDKGLHPLGLTLFKDSVYFSESVTGDVYKVHKDGGVPNKIYWLPESATDLAVFHTPKTRGSNQCFTNNGGCKNLCLALPNPMGKQSFVCACPTHYTLQNNICIPPTQFMIYSRRNLTTRLLPDIADCPESVLPIQGLKNVRAIEFDPVDNFLYWIEGKSHSSIKRSDAAGTKMPAVVQGNTSNHPFDLAIDSLGRLLFWTCSTQDVINVTRLNDSESLGIVHSRSGEKPRLLAIHPTKRLLFYTDVGEVPKLVRARLDGSHRINITKASDITAIAVDAENDLLIWAQGHSIFTSNIDGDNQHVLLNESNSRITLLTVHKGWLYWLDREIDQLQRLELKSGHRTVVLNHASYIVDLISVTQPDQFNPCSQSKQCSHLCLLNGTSAACACFEGLALLDDMRTCSALPNCGKDHFTCTVRGFSTKDCIPSSWRCDGQKDCKDGSDEAGCQTCGADQFKCHNGECIDKIQVCDGKADCSDRHDEANCCKSQNQFRCQQTEVCISRSQVCDGEEHCSEGEDEDKLFCSSLNATQAKSGASTVVIVIFTVASAALCFSLVFYFLRKKFGAGDAHTDQSEDPLSPMRPHAHVKTQKIRNRGVPDVVRMSMLNGSHTWSYDRNNITGASSSTNGSSSGCYPRETLNPPPSPATTATSTRASSPASRYRPYRHYRSINQPPPPTPCSTDVCDESDYNYPTRSRYDAGPFPPPPTPRSHCHSESCPPSPSSRSSTYFSPLPPPPSPVQSPRSYDS